MPIPSYQELMLPVLKLSVEERSVRDAIEKLSAEFGLTEEERQQTLAQRRRREREVDLIKLVTP